MDREKIYFEYKVNIANLLNSYLHEFLFLKCVIVLITLFWSLKIFSGHTLTLCSWMPVVILFSLSLSSAFKLKFCVSHLFYAFCMPCSYHLSWSNHINNMWWTWSSTGVSAAVFAEQAVQLWPESWSYSLCTLTLVTSHIMSDPSFTTIQKSTFMVLWIFIFNMFGHKVWSLTYSALIHQI
jgi:hypothetical protein